MDLVLEISQKIGLNKVYSKFYGKVGVISWLLFPISFEKITFYTEILMRKVELCGFFSLISLMKTYPDITTFLVIV